MKSFGITIAGLAFFSITTTALAHDPSEHQAEPGQPNCSAVSQDVAASSDPVMLAIRKKCASQVHSDANHASEGVDDHHAHPADRSETNESGTPK